MTLRGPDLARPVGRSSWSTLRPRDGSADGRRSAMVVDDEIAYRTLVEQVLVHDGYSVATASRPSEALALVGSRELEGVELVVTDVVLPEMDGGVLAALLRERDPATSILFISGHHRDDLLARGIAVGREFLEKPFSVGQLRDAVWRMAGSPSEAADAA